MASLNTSWQKLKISLLTYRSQRSDMLVTTFFMGSAAFEDNVSLLSLTVNIMTQGWLCLNSSTLTTWLSTPLKPIQFVQEKKNEVLHLLKASTQEKLLIKANKHTCICWQVSLIATCSLIDNKVAFNNNNKRDKIYMKQICQMQMNVIKLSVYLQMSGLWAKPWNIFFQNPWNQHRYTDVWSWKQ